jgi:hypothetical protein
MFSRPGVTYESAQTRKYQLGRTEVIRSASNESKEWVEAMSSPAPKVTLFSCHKVKYHLTFEIVYGIGPCLSNGSLPQGCISARSIFSVGSRWAGCGSTLVWAEEVSKGRRTTDGHHIEIYTTFNCNNATAHKFIDNGNNNAASHSARVRCRLFSTTYASLPSLAAQVTRNIRHIPETKRKQR